MRDFKKEWDKAGTAMFEVPSDSDVFYTEAGPKIVVPQSHSYMDPEGGKDTPDSFIKRWLDRLEKGFASKKTRGW